MTADEAELGAAERHEFRDFAFGQYGSVNVVHFVCWAGCPSASYLSMDTARKAHKRHQEFALGSDAMQRTYTPRMHP